MPQPPPFWRKPPWALPGFHFAPALEKSFTLGKGMESMKENGLSNGYSLADKVFKKLEEEILNGALKPGENLTELRVSERLGVSRTPVREAIHRLEQEGLVQLTPNKGAVVIGVSEQDLRDIYAIRMKLEGLASRWAAEHITEEEIISLRDILELQEFYTAKGDLEQLRNLDSQFHELIYQISGSRTLRQTLSSLHHSVQRYRKMSFATKGRAQKVMGEHQLIVDAIAAHDPDGAEKATFAHIEMAATNMLKNLGLSEE